METKLIKAALSKEVFNQLSSYIEEDILSPDLRGLWQTISAAHNTYEGDLDLDEVVELYKQTRVMTTAKREIFNLMMDKIREERIGSVELIKDLAKNLQVKELARKIADECLRVIDGKEGNFNAVAEFADRAKEVQETTTIGGQRDEAVRSERASTSLASILEETSDPRGLRFPHDKLQEKIGNPRGGNVILILGRPELGKTSFATSIAAGYLRQSVTETRNGSGVWGLVRHGRSGNSNARRNGEEATNRETNSGGSLEERTSGDDPIQAEGTTTQQGSHSGRIGRQTDEEQTQEGLRQVLESFQESGKEQRESYSSAQNQAEMEEVLHTRQCKVAYLANEEPVHQVCLSVLRACVNATADEIRANPQKFKSEWDKLRKGLFLFDATGWSIGDVNAMCHTYRPDVVVSDQTDKFNPTNSRTVKDFPLPDAREASESGSNTNSGVSDPGRYYSSLAGRYKGLAIRSVGRDFATWERMASLYPATREIAKLHNLIYINVTQASSGAAGRITITYDYTANNKTDKAAEADVVFGVGAGSIIDSEGEEECIRSITVSKNKITGWHGTVNMEFTSNTNQWV